MQTYQSMKDSGVAWLGEIPSEWKQKHAKYLFKQVKESVGHDPSKYELLSLTLRGIIPRSEVEGGKNPDNYSAYQVVQNNDLVMCLFDYDVTPRTVGRATTTGMVTGAYTNLRPLKGVSSRYYNYFFLALDHTKELLHLCTGLRNSISKPTFLTMNLPVPDYDTQERIANYLDEEIAKIDSLISKQNRLLELLEEKRRGFALKAITKGLDPDATLVETGVDWMPEVPSHWQVIKLAYLSTILSGYSPEQTSPSSSGQYPYFKVDALNYIDNAGELRNAKDCVDEIKFTESEPFLVFPKRGGAIFTNKVAIIKKRSAFDTNLMGLRLDNKRLDLHFMYHWLQARTLNELADTSTLPQINNKHISPLKVALPPVEEQQEIVQAIGNYMILHNRLKKQITAQILLLNERRISLISSVTTGKVRL